MKSASLPLSASSRSGPVLALVPASASVWQAPQAVEVPLPSVKSVLPSRRAPPAAAGRRGRGGAVSFCMKASYSAAVTTCAVGA